MIEIDLVIDLSNRLFKLLDRETSKMNERLDDTIKEFKTALNELTNKLDDVVNKLGKGK